ncbi:hypothetical protein HYU18_02155 [Candidatus Woesearchaeota archaeon]|nr:hypothetical protein [Candidatus Woesearchaeota archaeon]
MIVFDSSTLILLTKIELINPVLNDYKGDAFIAEAVKAETTAKEAFDGSIIKRLVETGKIKVKNAEGAETAKLMDDFRLDKGEAETITLALRLKNSLVATDDKNAIKACKVVRVDFATAMDFLIRAKEKGLLDVEMSLAMLEKLTKFGRYAQGIVKDSKAKLIGGK